MASIFGIASDYGPVPQMPPIPVDDDLPPTRAVEISDDDDNDDVIEIVRPLNISALNVHQNGSNVGPTSTMNIRLKPDTSPAARHNNKRQKLDDAPETSGTRVQYPRTRIEFTDSDDGFTQFHPAFFDDAFLFDYRDTASNSSIDTAAKLLEQEAIRQARRPPHYEDAKLKIRMYCGPGYQIFPLPVSYDPKFQEACDNFDAEDENKIQAGIHQDSTITIPQQDCLARILDVFPDIEHKFVLDRIKSQSELIMFPDEEVEMHPDSAAIINEVLEMESYPKQPSREDEVPDEFEDRLGKPIIWTRDHYQNSKYKTDTVALLAAHFDHVPTHFINSTVTQKGNLFDAFVVIDNIESDYFQRDRPYARSKRPRVQLEKKYQNVDPERDPPYYCKLVVELQAAKQHVLRKKLQSNQKQQIADAEVANLEQHRVDGLLIQCKCCFDEEVPMNRVVVCLADEEHPFCFDCIKNLAENQIGMRRHEMQCMDESGCKSSLELDGIGKAVPIKTFDRLQFNQQQAEIKAANIEGLEQCPLCDFQAICDPPEVDTIFSCQNPDCFKVTCRLCHEISHLPKTCEEVKKDRGLSARHKIEEARTQAMIRTCPSCQSAIVKSDGCNKMRCTCGTVICYACKLDLSKIRDAYDHFSRGLPSAAKCPLYDDKTIDRHVQEANEAEERAILQVKAEDNTIEEDTLRIETGKAKGLDRSRMQDVNGVGPPPARQGVDDYLGVDMLENFNDIAHRIGRRAARRNGGRRGHMRDDRNAQWLQDVHQNFFPARMPPIADFGQPLQGLQPLAPAVPQHHNNQIAQPNPQQQQYHHLPQPPAFPPLLNQNNSMNALNPGPRPRIPDPGNINIDARVNDYDVPRFVPHEQPQDRRLAIFGVRPGSLEVPVFDPNVGLRFGTQPPVRQYINDLHHDPGVVNGNNLNGIPQIQNPPAYQNRNWYQNQNQGVPQQPTAAPAVPNVQLGQAQTPNTGRARTWQNQGLQIIAPHPNGTRDRHWTANVNRDQNANGTVWDRGRPNRRQTIPLDGINAGIPGCRRNG